jgi:hypothetical protein
VSWKTLVAVLAGAVLCVPVAAAAPAKHSPKLPLALVPLQQAQLGPAAASLTLQWFDFGTVSNNAAAFMAPGPVEPQKLKRLGRVTGYLLDYGIPYRGGTGLTEIKTGVDEYRTRRDAEKALPFWRKQDGYGAKSARQLGVHLTFTRLKVKTVGSSRFAYLTSMSIPHADPMYAVDEQFVAGRFILDSYVVAGTKAVATRLAPHLAALLDHRLRSMLAGRLHGHAAPRPPLPEPGPPPGGPDLSTFVLGPADFSPGTVISQGYSLDPEAISSYGIDLHPAGAFADIIQGVNWYADANETTWQGTFTDYEIAQLAALASMIGGVTPVDVSAAGDNAEAVILPYDLTGGRNGTTAVLSLWQGQATDVVLAASASQLQASDVQSLAQKAADHLNSGLLAKAQAPTTWTSQRRSRSRSSSMKRTRCQVPSWSSPLRTGTDSPAVPRSIAMQWEWPLPWSMSSGQMFSVRRSQSSCA